MAKQARALTGLEKRAVAAIRPGRGFYKADSWEGHFAAGVQHLEHLTERQLARVWELVWKFRERIEDPGLEEAARLETLPGSLFARPRRPVSRRNGG